MYVSDLGESSAIETDSRTPCFEQETTLTDINKKIEIKNIQFNRQKHFFMISPPFLIKLINRFHYLQEDYL